MLDKRLDQLANDTVPPAPRTMADEVHHRVNRHLAALQTFDLLLRVVPHAAWQFGRAVWELAYFTLAGKFCHPPRGDDRRK